MTKQPDPEQLRAAAVYLRAQLNVLPRINVEDGDVMRQHHRREQAAELLGQHLRAEYGARISDRWDGARISMLGVTSTSTSGLPGAMTNWCAAADKRAAKLEATP